MGAPTEYATTAGPAPVHVPHTRVSSPKHRAASLYIHTTEPGCGKVLVSLGLMDLIQKQKEGSAKIGFFRPLIGKGDGTDHDEDIDLILHHFQLKQTFDESYGTRTNKARQLLSDHRKDDVIEVIIAKYRALEAKCDFVLCEGRHGSSIEFNLNLEMAKNLGCQILILGSAQDRTVAQAMEPIQISVEAFQSYDADVVAIVINKAEPRDVPKLADELDKRFKNTGMLQTVIPYEKTLINKRIYDVVEALQGEVLFGKDCLNNPVSCSILATMQLQHVLNWITKDECLVITSGDRGDIIVGAMQAHQSTSYPRIAGIVLTGGERPGKCIELLLEGALDTIPIILVEADSFITASKVNQVKASLKPTDLEKISLSIRAFSHHLQHTDRFLQRVIGDSSGIVPVRRRELRQTQTPKMFEFDLVSQAKEERKHIVLPEGNDLRIIKAAAQLAIKGIAEVTLLGNQDEIIKIASNLGVQLISHSGDINILDPCSCTELLDKYAEIFFQLRKHKGTVPNLAAARDEVMDFTTFGTMMVHCGDADGLVSGACHTTRHTIRPALQIIKTKPGVQLVSSVFLMCLATHVLVYGDCAINPNPNAAELADIAIASAETAYSFNIDTKVAMLSYSSGDSGKGSEVEKVREATRLARAKRPDLLIEGPIQYDAAVDPSVAASKMPNSAVAGQATVFVFPDLNTGNTAYKAIQRETTGAVCIGPILQGLKKPVNDLSRGCTVQDIVSTCIVTCCQAQQAVA